MAGKEIYLARSAKHARHCAGIIFSSDYRQWWKLTAINNLTSRGNKMQLVNLNEEVTMSSLDFLDNIINPVRVQSAETPHEPRKFLAKIEDELDLNGTGKKFRLNNNRTQTAYYELNLKQMLLVGMRESKAVRRSVLDALEQMQTKVAKLEEMNQRLTNEDELSRLRQQLAQAQSAQWRAEDMFYFEHNALMRIEDKKSFEEQAAAAIDNARQAWSQRCDMREDLTRAEAAISGLQNKLAIALEYAGADVALLNK